MAMDTNDFRIRKVTVVDQICDQIRAHIKKNHWQPDERLPSENELAELFGVNRLTIRLALQKLNALGVIETRTGSGSYVVQFDFSNHIHEVSDLYLEPELLDNVCEFRKLVEVECAHLAIERGTPEELAQLEALLDDYNSKQRLRLQEPSLENSQQCARADLAFHKQIVDMAHNKLYSYSFSVAQQAIYQYVLILDQKRMEKGLPQIYKVDANSIHENIFNAIRERNFEECRRLYTLMVDHNIEL